MDNQEKISKLEDKLYQLYQNKEIPLSSQNTIMTALEREPKHRDNIINIIIRIIMYIITAIILTGGVAFAVNYISNIFTNSTDAIDTAVEHDYIQNIDMDFVYKNDIGIKIDYILLDDNSLDISFVYNTSDENVAEIHVNEFIIRDENNNVIAYEVSDESMIDLQIKNNHTRTNAENFRESILCTLQKTIATDKILVEIINVEITDNNLKNENINGNWLFNVDLDNEMVYHSSQEYIASYNKYINNISAKISETMLNIEISFNTKLDTNLIMNDIDAVILTNTLNEQFDCQELEYSDNYMKLCFDLSKYNDNIDILNLYIKIDKEKECYITLEN